MIHSNIMDYPLGLGSFPRFGNQERWAIERRQWAIENSIATRQAMAARNLMVERPECRKCLLAC